MTQRNPRNGSSDFPLFAHSNRPLERKMRPMRNDAKGKPKLSCFGAWADPKAAYERYMAQKDDILAGRDVRGRSGVKLIDRCDRFLTSDAIFDSNPPKAGVRVHRVSFEAFGLIVGLITPTTSL